CRQKVPAIAVQSWPVQVSGTGALLAMRPRICGAAAAGPVPIINAAAARPTARLARAILNSPRAIWPNAASVADGVFPELVIGLGQQVGVPQLQAVAHGVGRMRFDRNLAGLVHLFGGVASRRGGADHGW